MKIKDEFILITLFVLCLSVPNGVANLFLPASIASATTDDQTVFQVLISFQTLLTGYFVAIAYVLSKSYRLSVNQMFPETLLALLGILVFSLFSFNAYGYLSYMLMFLTSQYLYLYAEQKKGINTLNFFGYGSVAFLPIYCIDFFFSFKQFGFSDFSSYLFASNGHSFVSFLFCLIILFYCKSVSSLSFATKTLYVLAFVFYFVGGVISGGRMPLMALMLTLLILFRSKFKTILALLIIMALGLYLSVDKVNQTVNGILNFDSDDITVWSSLFSRFIFWETSLNIFNDYYISGAGGLFFNQLKNNYGYPFNVFVDPHNEFIFMLVGFGLSGSFISIFIFRSLRKFKTVFYSSEFRPNNLDLYIFVIYIFLSSLTNANTAKSNIQFLVLLVLNMVFLKLYSNKSLSSRSD